MPSRACPRVALALLAALAACAPPVQNGGVEVQAGASSRLTMICRWRHGAVEGGNPCASPEERASPARVRRIEAETDKLSGPFALGRAGDYLLENDEVAVVIGALGRGVGFAESGGNLVDAADVRARRDELGQMSTYFGTSPRQAIYEAMDSGKGADGAAWIEVRGHELHEPGLDVVTRYVLSPGQRALLITTSLTNKTGAPIEALELGDAIQWGGAQKFAPGEELGFTGDVMVPFLGGVGRQVGYGIIGADEGAAEAGLAAKNGTAWSNLSFARGVSLAPGQRATYSRALVIGARGDTLGVVTELYYLRGGTPGGLEVELIDAQGARLSPPVDGRITLREEAPADKASGGKAPAARVPLWLQIGPEMAEAGANAAAELPPGRYLVGFEGAGRRAASEVPVSIEAGKLAKIKLAVSAAGALLEPSRAIEIPVVPGR